MIRRTRILGSLLVAVLLGGCGSHSINYKGPPVDLTYSGKRPLAVCVLDKRPYILSQEKPPEYVGTIRGGYGNPFNQRTESGDSLAGDFLYTVSESLKSRGFPVTTIPLHPADTPQTALKEFSASGTERFLLLTIQEWQNDYYPASFGSENSYILFKATLQVFNRKNQVIGESGISGENHLPSGWPKETVPVFYQEKIRQLLNDPKIAKAL